MGESLHRRIARELAQQIAVGAFAPDSLFPTEVELYETWQVNRHTVCEVLRELTEQGLISQRKGTGTRICEPKVSDINHLLSYLEDLLLLTKDSLCVIEKIDEAVADIKLPQMVGCPPDSRWLHIASTREDAQNPDASVRRAGSYASTDYAKLHTYIRDDPHSLISDLIEAHYDIKSHKVHQTITAVSVPKKVAKILSIAPDSPVMRIVRRYLDEDGKMLETMISIHPAGRCTYSITLKSQSSGG